MTAAVKLPVWATVLAAWRYLVTQWRIVLPLAVFLLLIAPASVLWPAVLSPIVRPFSAMPYFQIFLETVLTELPFLALAAIALIPLHRAILTGPPQPDRRIPFRLGRREGLYFLLVVAMAVGYGLYELAIRPAIDWYVAGLLDLILTADRYGPVMGLAMTAWKIILTIPVIAALVYVLDRLSLALPAIATDRAGPLSHAWTISRGNGWRLVAVLFIAILPLMVVAAVFVLSNPAMFRQIPVVTDNGILVFMRDVTSLSSALFFIAWDTLKYTTLFLIEATALSMSYRALGGLDEGA